MLDLKNQIIIEIQRVAKELGRETISRTEFEKLSGISQHQIYKIFNGWTEAVSEAGLTPHTKQVKKVMSSFSKISILFV